MIWWRCWRSRSWRCPKQNWSKHGSLFTMKRTYNNQQKAKAKQNKMVERQNIKSELGSHQIIEINRLCCLMLAKICAKHTRESTKQMVLYRSQRIHKRFESFERLLSRRRTESLDQRLGRPIGYRQRQDNRRLEIEQTRGVAHRLFESHLFQKRQIRDTQATGAIAAPPAEANVTAKAGATDSRTISNLSITRGHILYCQKKKREKTAHFSVIKLLQQPVHFLP